MIKIMFVCLGNICRSPMAEFVMKDKIRKLGKEKEYIIKSSATSNEEIGNDIHYGTKQKLKQENIPYEYRKAVRLQKEDYDEYDYIIGMESSNVRNIKQIVGEDIQGKIFKLLEFSKNPRDIADPWYTGNFDKTYKDIVEGCDALLEHIEKVQKLKEMINKSSNIVFFGGAGVSTESGIPDFRSKDGLYNQKYDFPPEEILSHTFFIRNTEDFYKFYKEKMNSLKYEPNITHYKLVELEKNGKLKAIITQNIDGLHQKAGSKNVYELHGSVLRNYCMKCNKFYDGEYVFNSQEIPKCECGGIIKPDVVLYEEGLDDSILYSSIYAIQNADLLIVAGTSLTVQPAASLINYFRGKNLILINKEITPYDKKANLVINEGLGKIFKEI